MFRKHNSHKKRSTPLPFVILRVILSLTMMTIFGLGLYQAYKQFSGVDPFKVDPKTLVISYISSEDSLKIVNRILGLNIPGLSKILHTDSSGLSGIGGNQLLLTDQPRGELLFKFAIIADSHSDNENLKKAVSMAKDKGAKLIIGLGDYTDVGTLEELEAAKIALNSAGLSVYLTAGDHDLWEGREKGVGPEYNFIKVFGPPYQSFSVEGVRFILIDNADNYQGIDEVQREWIKQELARVVEEKPILTLVFLHEPLYHPSSDRMMGKSKDALKAQASELVEILSGGGVNEVFAGDVHFFSRFVEPKTNLNMTTVGALTSVRNAQAPRFAIVDVYEGGSYNVEDIELK